MRKETCMVYVNYNYTWKLDNYRKNKEEGKKKKKEKKHKQKKTISHSHVLNVYC